MPDISYEVVPVGHGYASITRADWRIVTTDGGTDKTSKVFGDAYKKLARLLYCNQVDPIISHFDYDHVSLVSELAVNKLILFGNCYLPGSLSRRECTSAAARFMALEALLAKDLDLYSTLPSRDESIVNILRMCKKDKTRYVFQGDNIPLINSHTGFHVLWPTKEAAEKHCRELINEIDNLVESYCEETNWRDSNLCKYKDKLDEFSLDKIDELLPRTSEKTVEYPRYKDRRYAETDYIPVTERTVGEPLSELIAKKLAQRSRKLEESFINLVYKYRNLTAIAYSLDTDYTPEPRIVIRNSNAYRVPGRYITEYRKGHYPVVIYLSDLKEWGLKGAIKYFLEQLDKPSGVPVGIPVLIAPHHGTVWSDLLSNIEPFLTVLSNQKINRHLKTGNYQEISYDTVVTSLDNSVKIHFKVRES